MSKQIVGALTLLVAFLCINWCDGLSCGTCNVDRCRKLSRTDCPYGIEKDFCNCCQQCLKGPGEPCGGIAVPQGSCGGNLVCVGAGLNFGGICLPKERCFSTVRCAPGRCPPISSCRNGIGKNSCSCCRTCLKGAGERCGNRKPGRVPCGANLECVGETSSRLGTCLKIQLLRCPRRIFCRPNSTNFPRYCRFGFSKPACSCYNRCKRNAYRRCGYRQGNCRAGYICQGHKYTIRYGRYFFTSGRCTRPGACPYRIRCNRRRCPVLRCAYGSAKPQCGCCPQCLKGEEERCGIQAGLCKSGLSCKGSKVQVYRGRPTFTTGVCVTNWFCPRPPPCAPPPPFLNPPQNCRWGYSRAICGCTAICNNGPGQKCGFGVNCGPGYYCKGLKYVRQTEEYKDGICTSTSPPRTPYYWPPFMPIYSRWLIPWLKPQYRPWFSPKY